MKCRELVSVAELTTGERTAFTNAVLALKAAPSQITDAATAVTAGGGTPNRYDDYVWMHSTIGGGAHFGPAFGAWHREFLRQFEFDLRDVSGNPDIVIPYWDWTTGRSSASSNWPFTDDLLGPLGDATGVVASGPFSDPTTFRMNLRRVVEREDGNATVNDTNLRLRRRPAATAEPFALPTATTARQCMAQTTPYDASPFNEFDSNPNPSVPVIQGWIAASFRKFLEWVMHNGPHVWVGGEDNWVAGPTPTFIAGPMSIPAVSPNDPVFWLHHCNVDRLWSTWQQRRGRVLGIPVAPYVPTTGANAGHNLDNEMIHFEAANAGNFNTSLNSTPASVVDSRATLDIWYKSDLPIITLVTPSIDFGDVPANLTTDWPVKFDVRTCRPVKFRITAVGGANFRNPPGQTDVPADHDHDQDPVRTNVFLEFVALGTANVVQAGTATIRAFIDDDEGYYSGTVGAEVEVGRFDVTMSAKPVPAPRAAVTFVLDRSGSMGESAGPAGTKYDLLRSSLRVVSAIMRNDDAIGLVSYDNLTAALTPTMVQMGAVLPPGPGREAVETAITTGALAPRGATGIGAGMIAGASVLGSVQADTAYAIKAMVVMTDGNENRDPSVTHSSVATAIAWFNNAVYAIGLGDETNVSTATLGAISRFQLITGRISTNEQRFLLTKYFLQILATISDTAIIVDPQGELRPGDVHRIPFDVADSDVSIDVVAICPVAPLLDLTLEAPDGTVIHAGSSPNVTLQIDSGDEFYRVLLPAVPGAPAATHAGRWNAVLRIRDLRKDATVARALHSKDHVNAFAGIDRQALASVAERGALPYQVFVQGYSNLKMTVDVQASGFLPGSTFTLTAALSEYRRPVAGARVQVELTAPDGTEVRLPLAEVAPGQFQAAYTAWPKGVYRCRFLAAGRTRGGRAFQREDTRTAAINPRLAPGGDLSVTVPPDGGDRERERWCALVACLLREPSVVRLLEKHEVERRELLACLKRFCAAAPAGYGSKVLTHVEHIEREEPEEGAVMSDDTESLRRTIAALRAELDKGTALDTARWEGLLAEPPVAVAPPTKPAAPAIKKHGDIHAAHHHRALPVVVLEEDGEARLIVPAGFGKAAVPHSHEHDPPKPAEPAKPEPPPTPHKPHGHGGKP